MTTTGRRKDSHPSRRGHPSTLEGRRMFRMCRVLFLELPCLEQRRRKFRTPLRSSPRGWPGSPTGPPARPRPRRPRPRSNNRQQAQSLSPPRSAPISLSIDQLFPYLDRGSCFRMCRKFLSPRRIRRIQTPPRTPSPPSLRDAGGAPLMAPLPLGEGGEGPPATSTLLGPASTPQSLLASPAERV